MIGMTLTVDNLKSRLVGAGASVASGLRSASRSVSDVLQRKHRVSACALCMMEAVAWLEATWRERGYGVQVLRFSENMEVGSLVQIRNDGVDWKRDVVRTVGGRKLAVNVRLLPHGDDLLVEIGNGKWLDKTFSGILAWTFFAPLMLIPIVGAYRQKRLLDQIEKELLQWLECHRHAGAIEV